MSDFLLSSSKLDIEQTILSFQHFYRNEKLNVFNFHGAWGSLFVSKGYYRGFEPFESENHIIAVIGGPVLNYQTNEFLSHENSSEGSMSILNRWLNHKMTIFEDLNGPFVIVIIDKSKHAFHIITDIGLYIPVFIYQRNEFMIGTHVDIVAISSKSINHLDKVSLMDFYVNGNVTYPFTVYKHIFQLKPACVHFIDGNTHLITELFYWNINKKAEASSLKSIAKKSRYALENYINRITDSTKKVGLFISGGEDSRFVLSLLPSKVQKDAYIFLESLNHEGKIAKKATKVYGANFNYLKRNKNYYLDIIESSSLLMGSGVEYKHGHAYEFARTNSFEKYSCFFGGYQADTLLKAYWLKIERFVNNKRVKGVFVDNRFTQQYPLKIEYFNQDLYQEILLRRKSLYDKIMREEKSDKDEWFFLWPRSMGPGMSNFYCTRRLFASYEVFMINEIFEIISNAPLSWRATRKLYHHITKPNFKKSKYLRNAKGSWPYWRLPIDDFLIFSKKVKRKMVRLVFQNSKNEGPWSEWHETFKSEQWHEMIDKNTLNVDSSLEVFSVPLKCILESKKVHNKVKLNIIQSMIQLKSCKEFIKKLP